MKASEKFLWGLGAIAFLVGGVGLVQRLLTGHIQAGYGTYVPWGLWIGIYAMFIGMSAGAFLLASVSIGLGIKRLEPLVRPALLLALATFIGGMLAVWLDLGHPLRAWRLILATGFTSVMGWMAWLYTVYFVLLVALLWLVAWKGQFGTRLVRSLGFFGAVLAVIFSGAEGALFGVVGARDLWHSGMTPIMFLVEGALSGVALVVCFALLFNLIERDLAQIMRWVVLGLLLTALLLEWAELTIGYYASIPAYASSLTLMLFGPFWWVFWVAHVALGVLLPLVLLTLDRPRGTSILVATGLIAVTALSTKLSLIVTAQAVPGFEALRQAYNGPGLTFDYFPTPVEWLVGVWIVGVVLLVALAGYRLLLQRPMEAPRVQRPQSQPHAV